MAVRPTCQEAREVETAIVLLDDERGKPQRAESIMPP